MVYGLDDAVMYRSANASSPYSATREKRFARTVMAIDHVIAGNTFLRVQTRQFTEQVTIAPIAIDIKRYTPKNFKKSKKVTVGWIGIKSTLPYLGQIKSVLCDTFFNCTDITVVKKMWKAEGEVEDL
jgi:glycosyltransferase involved in cell wall biosynthesis